MNKAWAQAILNSNAVILDTETTGGAKTDQVIQLSIVDMRGRVLFDSMFHPTCEINPMAAQVHHLTKAHLRSAPPFADTFEVVKSVLDGRSVIAYNASFDKRMMMQTSKEFGLDAGWLEQLDWQCAMRAYADHLGVKNAPKLAGGDHSAKGDCLATLDVLRKMAGCVEGKEPDSLKKVEEKPDTCPIATVPAPPLRFVAWALATLRKRAATGDYPPAGWIESLEVIEQALLTNEAAQLEVIAQTDIAPVAAIDGSRLSSFGVDVTRLIGTEVTDDTLFILRDETKRHYGDSWQVFAEPVESSDLWRVRGVKAK